MDQFSIKNFNSAVWPYMHTPLKNRLVFKVIIAQVKIEGIF